MRTIKIPLETVVKWVNHPVGTAFSTPVKVDWPELNLTEEQILANSIARVNGLEEPYPDNSIFCVEIS